MEYKARNYAQLAPQVYRDLLQNGIRTDSRNGPVLRHPEVVTMTVERPWERVNVSPVRDANPFFHFVEAMAMLANVNSVRLMSYFAKNMATFSDDGETYNAFYGTRARGHFPRLKTLQDPELTQSFETPYLDQLTLIVDELRENPLSRQAVLQLWDPVDLERKTKDKACNLCLLFEVLGGKLRMTSFNRSNDAIWGICTGANVVHLSYFQEYVACSLKLEMGSWTHVSNNLHVYTSNPLWPSIVTDATLDPSPHVLDHRVTFRPGFMAEADAEYAVAALKNFDGWLAGKEVAFAHMGRDNGYATSPIVSQVLIPMLHAYRFHKLKDRRAAHACANAIADGAWKRACIAWLARRDPVVADTEDPK